jgi:hypothetical protein
MRTVVVKLDYVLLVDDGDWIEWQKNEAGHYIFGLIIEWMIGTAMQCEVIITYSKKRGGADSGTESRKAKGVY